MKYTQTTIDDQNDANSDCCAYIDEMHSGQRRSQRGRRRGAVMVPHVGRIVVNDRKLRGVVLAMERHIGCRYDI